MYLLLAFVVTLLTAAHCNTTTPSPGAVIQNTTISEEPGAQAAVLNATITGGTVTNVTNATTLVPTTDSRRVLNVTDAPSNNDDDNIYTSFWFIMVMVATGIVVVQVVIFITVSCVKNHMVIS